MPDLHDSSNEPTVATPQLRNLGSASAHSDGPCCKVAMCKGSSPHLSKETQSLLRSRLRISALLLGAGFSVFFVRQLFFVPLDAGTQYWVFMMFFGIMSLGLLLLGGGLCHRHTFKLSTLRKAELAIFGLPALFFVFLQWRVLTAREPILTGITSPWILLILVYSLFIPNTWQRAAWVLGLFAAAPVALLVAVMLTMSRLPEAVTPFNVSTAGMLMVLTAIVGIRGVYTINRLRREAFEARQLGQYKLKRLLGAGGMGEVHLAEHQLMKRPVAIKLIKPGKAADPVSLARFEREVRATAQLSHWNTIEIFDYGHTDDGTFYYVMEYLPGKSLADLVAEHGALAPSRVVWLLEQTCEALAEAHSLGLIHRDIKPGNIFAAERGGVFDVAKLLDFGLAKPATSNGDMNLTQEGSITGSPLFMAPEQATGDGAPDARSDIYALGAVGYYLLTGHPPFEADNPVKVLLAHAQQTVKPPSQWQAGVPADLERIILRCLAKNRDDRFPDVNSLAAALRQSSLHGGWTREDAHRWWTTNGGVDRSGSRDELPKPSADGDARTHDSATSPTAVLA